MLPESIRRARDATRLDHLPAILLETPRLVLRPFLFNHGDWAAFSSYMLDPEVTRFLTTSNVSDREAESHFVSNVIGGRFDRRWLTLAIERRSGHVPVGECSLHASAGDPTTAFLGYILRRDAWGSGLASEASAALLKYGFETLRFSQIVAGFTPENVRSRRVLERLGFERSTEPLKVPNAPPGVTPEVFLVRRATWLDRSGADRTSSR